MDAVFLNNYLFVLVLGVIVQVAVVVAVGYARGSLSSDAKATSFWTYVGLLLLVEVIVFGLVGTGVLSSWLPKVSIV